MELPIPQKRKKKKTSKQVVENYYKILGTTAKASEKTIRERYIEKVREFTPETHPEEFQKIRTAYETLKNPRKRQEYDIQRLYGHSVEDILEKANTHVGKGQTEKAKALLEKALVIDPHNLPARFALGDLYLDEENIAEYENVFTEAYNLAENDDEKVRVLVVKARIALDNDEPEMALEALEKLQESHEESVYKYSTLWANVYMELDMNQELWDLAQRRVDRLALDTWDAEDWPIYYNWLIALVWVGNWSMKGKVISRVKKYLRNLQWAEDEQEIVLDDLWESYHNYVDDGSYKEASVFLELLKALVPKDPDLKREVARFQKEEKISNEVDRVANDYYLFPPLRMAVCEVFLEEYFPERLEFFLDSIPPEISEMYDSDDEGFVESLALLKRKYKGIYHQYKEKWDALYEEKKSSLNREARRSIKY
jgi:tetratricopeptide (TPR) repeat protein